MATETAERTASQEPASEGARRPLRELWQVPVFVAGLLALTGVWLARPSGAEPGGRQAERDLAASRRALDQLPPIFREALVLREIEGMSYKEIAQALQIPIGTVMSRISRARRQLQQSLFKYASERGYLPVQATQKTSEKET